MKAFNVLLIMLVISLNAKSQNNIQAILSSSFNKYNDDDYVSCIKLASLAISKDKQCFEAYFIRSKANLGLGNKQNALQDINICIKIAPEFADAYFERGMIYRRLDNDTQAIKDYNTAIIKSTDKAKLAEMYLNRAMIKSDFLDYLGAIKDCNESLRCRPDDNMPSYNLRGYMKLLISDYIGAIDDSNIAIEMVSGDFWEPYFTRGMAYLKTGNKDLAFLDLKKASALTEDYRPKEALSKNFP